MNEIEILDSINEIGYLLLRHGAEIYRVEESITRMCEAYNFKNIEVFAIPTYYTISLTLHNGTPYQTTKRSRTNRIHLDHLYELNCLVRKISSQEMDYQQINEQIDIIKSRSLNLSLICFGYVISSAMFCGFFGGGTSDMILSGVIGFVLYFFIYLLEKLYINGIVRTILASMVLATIAILGSKMNVVINQQAIITGTLMLLVPGIAITNSLRDIISGDFISGLSRMSEAILIAASIAIGVGIMMMILKGV